MGVDFNGLCTGKLEFSSLCRINGKFNVDSWMAQGHGMLKQSCFNRCLGITHAEPTRFLRADTESPRAFQRYSLT